MRRAFMAVPPALHRRSSRPHAARRTTRLLTKLPVTLKHWPHSQTSNRPRHPALISDSPRIHAACLLLKQVYTCFTLKTPDASHRAFCISRTGADQGTRQYCNEPLQCFVHLTARRGCHTALAYDASYHPTPELAKEIRVHQHRRDRIVLFLRRHRPVRQGTVFRAGGGKMAFFSNSNCNATGKTNKGALNGRPFLFNRHATCRSCTG